MINGPHVSSTGTELPMINGSADLGSVAASMRVYFTVTFTLRNQAALENLISEQSQPGSPNYHRFLTLAQFEKSYGPSQRTYVQAVTYFEAMGLNSIPTGTHTTLAFSGTAAQVENAFGTGIHLYRLANGTIEYANNEPLSLPAAIGDSIASVNGLTSIVKVQPMLVHAPPVARSTVAGASGSGQVAANATMARAVNFTEPGYLYTGSSFLTGVTQFLNPSTLTVAYNATPLYRAGDLGQGSTIAVVMAGGYNPSDLSTYSQLVFNDSNQIANRLTAYPVNGGISNATSPGTAFLTSRNAFEFTLDIEYSATMAPAARIDAVYGPTLSIASLVSAYARLTTLNPLPNVVTNSWGGWEDTWWNLYGPSWQSALSLENYFMELTAMGATILAPSGDRGGFDNYSSLLSPVFPASSPYVVAVGGVRTTAVNATGVAFPSQQYVVNQTVALYGWSEVTSHPYWVPDYPLSGSNVSGAGSEAYWYYAGSGGPDGASGGIGLSYWFQQPWWQHAPSVPNTGRRMIADIAAAADYNETFYFAGAWNFFWGGTSFATPTEAGMFALLDTYLNSTTGNTSNRTSYYLGLAQPLLYRLGSDSQLGLPAFVQIASGNNSWDYRAANGDLGWPGTQNWSSGWTSAAGKWNMLTGWGVPDIYNLVNDSNQLLNPNSSADQNMVTLSGGPVYTLPDSGNYTLTLTDRSGSPIPGASITLAFTPSGGSMITMNETTALNGTFNFNPAMRAGYLSIYSTSASGSGFQSIWFSKANLTGGELSLTVLGHSSVMGGFDVFNGLVSPQYPALEPLMPNTVAVEVTYSAGPTTPSVPVYNAVVTVNVTGKPYFSSPPTYPNSYYNNTLGNTGYRSLSFTNLMGTGYVETWNVGQPQAYLINVTYLGLTATAVLNVTPRYVIQSTNQFASSYASLFGGTPGYIGSGANSTIVAPAAEGAAEYSLPVMVTDWQGKPLAGVPVEVALMNLVSPPFDAQPVPGTITRTNSSGIAEILVNNSLTVDSIATGGVLLIRAFNTSYTSLSMTALNNSIVLPSVTNDSYAVLELLQPAFGEVQTMMKINGALTATSYLGSTGNSASFYISTPDFGSNGSYDNITSINYSIDGPLPVTVPLPGVGQRSFLWTFDLPTLSLGNHTLAVRFTDSLGFAYSVPYSFQVIGNGVNPSPAITITYPGSGAYITGETTISFVTEQTAFLIYETLTIGQVSYDVMGMNSFTFNASDFGYGPLFISLKAANINGVSSYTFMELYDTPQPVPTATITSPADYSVFGDSSNLTVGLSYSGNYLVSELLTVKGPGANSTYNASGVNSVLLKGLSRGVYSLEYTVTSADGYKSISVVHFTILSTTPISPGSANTYISYLADILIATALAVGLVTGMAVDRLIRRKSN